MMINKNLYAFKKFKQTTSRLTTPVQPGYYISSRLVKIELMMYISQLKPLFPTVSDVCNDLALN